MPNSTTSLVGNLTSDPSLRFTNGNQAVVNFSLAVNDGSKDKPHTSYYDVQAWGTLAENVASTLAKGNRAIVYGVLRQRTWESDQGKRSKVEVVADAIGPDLRFSVAVVQGTPRTETPRSSEPRHGGDVPLSAGDVIRNLREQIPGTTVVGEKELSDEPF